MRRMNPWSSSALEARYSVVHCSRSGRGAAQPEAPGYERHSLSAQLAMVSMR